MNRIEVIPFKAFVNGTWSKPKHFTVEDAIIIVGISGWCTLLVGLTKELIDAGVLPK